MLGPPGPSLKGTCSHLRGPRTGGFLPKVGSGRTSLLRTRSPSVVVAASPQSPSQILGLQQTPSNRRSVVRQLELVNRMKPLSLETPPLQNLLELLQAADRDKQSLQPGTLVKLQELVEDALDKLTPSTKASSLNPVRMATILQTVAILSVLNTKQGRSHENELPVYKMSRLLVSAGEKVYNSSKPQTLLDVLDALDVLNINVGKDNRARQLQSVLASEDRFLDGCSSFELLSVLTNLEPIASEISSATVQRLRTACDRLVSSQAKTSLGCEELSYMVKFFASLPQVSLRPEPDWLLEKAEAALSLLSPSADPDQLVLVFVSLLAPDSTLRHSSDNGHLQQAVRAACMLLLTSKGFSCPPLAAPSSPKLLTTLSQLVYTSRARVMEAMDPKLPSHLATYLLSRNNSSHLAYHTALLLINLAQLPPTTTLPQHKQQQQQQQQQQQHQGVRASAAAAAEKLLQGWQSSKIPDDPRLLLELPMLSRAAGAPLMHPTIQTAMEEALQKEVMARSMQGAGSIFDKVVMPIAEAGGHCLRAQTLDISVGSVDDLANNLPPSRLAILVGSFSMASWSPKSLLRTRLLVAAFRCLPRCSPLELQQVITAAGRVLQKPADSLPFTRLLGIFYESYGSIHVPSAQEWSAQVEACLLSSNIANSQPMTPDARCALLYSLYVDMGGQLSDACLHQIMQPLVPGGIAACSPEALAQLMEVVAILGKAPATHDWALAVVSAVSSALSAGNLSGQALGRVVSCIPTFASRELGVISGPPEPEGPEFEALLAPSKTPPQPAAAPAVPPSEFPRRPSASPGPAVEALPAPSKALPQTEASPEPPAAAPSAPSSALSRKPSASPEPAPVPDFTYNAALQSVSPSPSPPQQAASYGQADPPASAHKSHSFAGKNAGAAGSTVSPEPKMEAEASVQQLQTATPLVLEAGSLVEAQVTALRPNGLEVELCSLDRTPRRHATGDVAGNYRSRRSRRRSSSNIEGSSSSSSDGGQGSSTMESSSSGSSKAEHSSQTASSEVPREAVAGMKGWIELGQLTAAPIQSTSIADLLPPGARIKAVVMPRPDQAAEVGISLSTLVLEAGLELGAMVSLGPAAMYELASDVWRRKEKSGQALVHRWRSSNSSSSSVSEEPSFWGYKITTLSDTSSALTAAGAAAPEQSQQHGGPSAPPAAPTDTSTSTSEIQAQQPAATQAPTDTSTNTSEAGALSPPVARSPSSPEPVTPAVEIAAVPAPAVVSSSSPAAARSPSSPEPLAPAELAAVQAPAIAAFKSPSPQKKEGQGSHNHAALFLQCQRFAKEATASMLQDGNLAQLSLLPDKLAGAACALAACDLKPYASWSKGFESVTQSLLHDMSPPALSRLLWSLARLEHHPSWLWLSIAAEYLAPHLSTMARDSPHHLALALGGLHAQFVRPDSVAVFMEAQLLRGSSSSSSSRAAAATTAGRGSKAADTSLYCPSHLSRLPPQAASIAKVTCQAAGVWVQTTSNPVHRRTTIEVLPEDLLMTCIGAVAAMNVPAHDPLCPLVLQLGSTPTAVAATATAFSSDSQSQPPLQQHFPTHATWRALLQSPVAQSASPNLVPDSVWLQLVGQQLCAKQQQQQQEQQGSSKRAPGLKQQKLLLARFARFENTLAALLALQMRGSAGGEDVTALSGFMHAGAGLLGILQLPPAAEEQKEQLEVQSTRAGRLISATVMLKNRMPKPYVQRFLDQAICQGLSVAAASMDPALAAGHRLTPAIADQALPHLARSLMDASSQPQQPVDVPGLLQQLRCVLATVQLCPPQEDQKVQGSSSSSGAVWHCYVPPTSFLQAAVAFLSACCSAAPTPQQLSAGSDEATSAASNSSDGPLAAPHHLISCVSILSDWLEAQQQLSQPTPDDAATAEATTSLGSFALNTAQGSCGLSLLLAQAPSIAPVLRAALAQMAGIAAQQSTHSAAGAAPRVVWLQALWLAYVLRDLDSQQHSNDSAGNSQDEESAASAAPLLTMSSSAQWDLLHPDALAGSLNSRPKMAAVAYTRLALVLQQDCDAIWQEVRTSSSPAMSLLANRVFGSTMPSTGWANAYTKAVGGDSRVLSALDACMLGQVASGWCAVGVGCRQPLVERASPYLPGYIWRTAEDWQEGFQMQYGRPTEFQAVASFAQRLWSPEVERLPLSQGINSCQLLIATCNFQRAARMQSEGKLGSAAAHVSFSLKAITESAIEACIKGQLSPQHAFTMLDLLSISSGLLAEELVKPAIQTFLPRASEFVLAHEGTEYATPTLIKCLVERDPSDPQALQLAQDLLTLLNRPEPLPLTAIQQLLDFSFGKSSEDMRPVAVAQKLEGAVTDATAEWLVRRAIKEAPRINNPASAQCCLAVASLCGITLSPPYDLSKPSPFMQLRAGVPASSFTSLLRVLAADSNLEYLDASVYPNTVCHLLRVVLTRQRVHNLGSDIVSIILSSGRAMSLCCHSDSQLPKRAAAQAFLLMALHWGDRAFWTFLDSYYKSLTELAASCKDYSVCFKALELMYSLRTRQIHDKLVLVGTGGMQGGVPFFDMTALHSHQVWASNIKEARTKRGYVSKTDKALLKAVVENGLQMLATSTVPSGQALAVQSPMLLPLHQHVSGPLADSSSSSSSRMDFSTFESSKERLTAIQASRDLGSGVGYALEDILAFSSTAGVMDGGVYASRHMQVWRAALVYGVATLQQPGEGADWDMLKKARHMFVEAAESAFSDPHGMPVLVEEVVAWLGPCLGNANITHEPAELPEAPFRRWLEAADWSGIFLNNKQKAPEPAAAAEAQGQGEQPSLLPPYMVEVSPHCLAAITGEMDPRWLLQLQAAWMLCPQFKQLFWEVMAHKAGWEVDYEPAAPPRLPLHKLLGNIRSEQVLKIHPDAMSAAVAAAGGRGSNGLALLNPMISLMVYKWPSWERKFQEARLKLAAESAPQNPFQSLISKTQELFGGDQEEQQQQQQEDMDFTLGDLMEGMKGKDLEQELFRMGLESMLQDTRATSPSVHPNSFLSFAKTLALDTFHRGKQASREGDQESSSGSPMAWMEDFLRFAEGVKKQRKSEGETSDLKLDDLRSRGQAKPGFGKQGGGGKGKALGSRKKKKG